MDLEETVDGRFEHASIINRDHAHLGEAIPAWLATTSDGRIHYIIGDKEVGLQLDNPNRSKKLISSEITTYKLDRPAQYSSFEVLVIGKLTTFQDLNGINDRHAAIEFTTRNIVIEILFYFFKPRI